MKLSKRQEYFKSKLNDIDKQLYDLSFKTKGIMPIKSVKELKENWFNRTINELDRKIEARVKDHYLNLNIKNNRELFSLDTKKVPKGKFNRFGDYLGIEIECYLNTDDFIDTSRDNCDHDCDSEYNDCECAYSDESLVDAVKIKFKSYLTRNNLKHIKNVTIATDGSLDTDSSQLGVEFKVLCKRGEYENLSTVLKFIEYYNGYVNKDNGLHVHFDARKFKDLPMQKNKLTHRLDNSLKYLSLIVPQSRLKSNYCKLPIDFDERYSAFNFTALKKYGTIECRLHSGTINFKKITNWIELIIGIVKSKELVNDQVNVSEWLKNLNVNDDIKTYFIDRAYHFNRDYMIDNFEKMRDSNSVSIINPIEQEQGEEINNVA